MVALVSPLLGLVFAAGVVVSLGFSWLLVVRLERLGARIGLSEALLGVLAALAADAPEITAAASALVHGDGRIGAGVVIGSNVFNLAALLGLAAVLAGRIGLHRRVITLSGTIALWICVVCLLVLLGVLSAPLGLLATSAALVPYLALLGAGADLPARLRLPATWSRWLALAVREEESELTEAIHPRRGGVSDALTALAATLVVVGASIVMEHTAATLGTRAAIPPIVTGGLVLAVVTSLPNAVAAIYLARRGRGTAVLSTALNSNALNVVVGLLVPASLVGLGAPSGQATLIAACYVGMSVLALACAYVDRGLRRMSGALIILAYAAFTAVLLASSS